MKTAPKMIGAAGAFLAGVIVLSGGTAFAHHSFAMFDQSKQVSIAGTVKSFEWTNPHAFIELQGPDGKLWSVELNSPNNLVRQGWKRTALKPGDKVTVILNPLRDGQNGGLFDAVTLPSGQVLGNPKPTGPINVPTPQ
ncbi:MAG TPA: DUF6152 family protein [Caulobacteraceae bacterium]